VPRVTELLQTKLKNGARKLRRGLLGASDYDETIPPEILDDAFFDAIRSTARSAPITTALEIGSSSGDGSTRAFVEGLRVNPGKPRLFCLELSVPRFRELQRRYADDPQVKCYNLTSVSVDRLPTEQQVIDFYREKETKLNLVPLREVLRWLRQDVRHLARPGNSIDGIATIKEVNGIDHFGMVLIDGSEFTGSAELDAVYGADFILLDDIGTFKNYANHQRLVADPNYRLVEKDETLRNGFAVFERIAGR
jgi:hypothetical protein